MNAANFNPGFRFSKLDAVVLFLGAFIAADMGALIPWFGAAMAFFIAHFFLFCNVVRMARFSELVWAALFVGLAFFTTQFGWPSWPVTFAISLVASMLLVGLEMRKPSYHGAFWRRINPGLPQWWDANRATLEGAV